MRLVVTGLFCLVIAASGAEPKTAPKKPLSAPANGIKTPGIQIPFASLKAELEFDAGTPAAWIGGADAVWIPGADNIRRIDPRAKEAKLGDPIKGLDQPCGGMVNAFNSLWIPDCGHGAIVRVDARAAKITATLNVGSGLASHSGLAATTDSVWAFTDKRGAISRIDPAANTVVAEFRVFPGCKHVAFGETALWVTCPDENKLMRANPQTNTVEKAIDVSARPGAIGLGENSIWVLCEKDGKIDRIDPKTNKVTKTIDLGAPAPGGSLAIGEGSLWVSAPGFPLTRVDMAGEKVVQQFWGEGAGSLAASGGSVWLADGKSGKLWKFDPKRIAATLAE